MDIETLKKEITRDEGRVNRVYLDSENYKTLGIGHLIKRTDPEWKLKPGTPIEPEVVDTYFNLDFKSAVKDSKKFFKAFNGFPDPVQHVVVNMMFNLGYNKLSKFKKFRKAVRELKWNKAADEMVDSKWYRQVKDRSRRLVNMMRAVD